MSDEILSEIIKLARYTIEKGVNIRRLINAIIDHAKGAIEYRDLSLLNSAMQLVSNYFSAIDGVMRTGVRMKFNAKVFYYRDPDLHPKFDLIVVDDGYIEIKNNVLIVGRYKEPPLYHEVLGWYHAPDILTLLYNIDTIYDKYLEYAKQILQSPNEDILKKIDHILSSLKNLT